MALLMISYLAGVLTILSPCILPILPFVLARADRSLLHHTLPLLAGMALTFGLVATLAAVGGGWAVHANEIGRAAAVAVLVLFGLALLSRTVAGIISRPAVRLGERLLRTSAGAGSGGGDALLIGVATGLLWAPCAGPILGIVLTGAALKGAALDTTLLLTAYAAGAATSLAVAVLAGGRIITFLKRTLGFGEGVRKGLGIAVLAGVASITLGLDTGLLSRLSYAGTAGLEQSLLDHFGQADAAKAPALAGTAVDAGHPYHSGLPVEGTLPSLDGAVTWLNSVPLSAEAMRGKIVLVDFWTYSCINCIRTLPYIRAWAEKYKDQGLVVIGVHSPEFAFEKKLDNVQAAVRQFGIAYPVAVDSDFRIWRAFRNSYWPALYFVDAQGRIRHHQFGEGGYARSERVIQELLTEAGGSRGQADLVAPDARGAQAAPDLAALGSGETYLGYDKATGFASMESLGAGTPRDYTGSRPRLNQWALNGNWTVGAEHIALDVAGGTIIYRFRARDLHLVMGSGAGGRSLRFRVTIDGAPPGASHGSDTDADGNGRVDQTRLYQLVRQSGEVRERTFEIRFLDPGATAYAFTFG
ncbi:cytochrome C biogenesis protein DipZ [Azorhizobium oxalatiphilum]|uniref:Cytochrome C biogenesis protein DipZ n=1 Tax=Azorhizobium oxalatiphilum TaxID=980631 RepID=A0A917FDL8_9HYPH|nr:cytochrome c biogenesis protein DipZ [Azorhizobium oxalatiphilum]GGF67944.1 cytochrome C biogenesis protein DipZ [Azorhizobium oxalatiphilum]